MKKKKITQVFERAESLEKEASTIVGWNANCIVDAIKNAEEIGRI